MGRSDAQDQRARDREARRLENRRTAQVQTDAMIARMDAFQIELQIAYERTMAGICCPSRER